jgi:ornithine cyclodeaminase
MTEAIEAIEAAFLALADQRLHAPSPTALNFPGVNGKVEVGGVYLAQTSHFVVNLRNNFLQNAQSQLPTNSHLILVCEAATGFPTAILADNGYISLLRAGATGALATTHCVVVIGSGRQAYIQLKALSATRPIQRVLVWGRTPASVDSYARQMIEDHDLNIEIAPSLEEAVRQADVLITATTSHTPLVKASWLKPGVHITAAGSNQPVKQEVEAEVLARADVIIADNYQQSLMAGEVHHALLAGVLSSPKIQGELSQVISGQIPGRTQPNQITLADLTGVEALESVIATKALAKAMFYGVGQEMEAQL